MELIQLLMKEENKFKKKKRVMGKRDASKYSVTKKTSSVKNI